ncbi:MAG TPA: LacI family DNA-binding transcriptional regulator [Bacillota bacterium]
MVTIKDVAKMANVSPSTVSRVIADHKHISAETKERVRKVMKELGYHPNVIARSLIKRSSQALGLVLSRSTESAFSNPFFPEILRGISTVTQSHHYSLVLAAAENYQEEAKQYLRMLMEKRVDGVIILASRVNDELIQRLAEEEYPFVVVGRAQGIKEYTSVNNDNIQAAYLAVRHLLNLGNQRIAFLNGPEEYTFCQDRFQGYCMALREYGIEVNGDYVRNAENLQEDGYRLTKELMSIEPRPHALFAADDLMAIGAYRALKEEGLSIPDDVAVIGFNDNYLAAFMEPPLTTVRIPIYEMGVVAAQLIFHILQNKEACAQQRILSSQLIVRESCGAKRKFPELAGK